MDPRLETANYQPREGVSDFRMGDAAFLRELANRLDAYGLISKRERNDLRRIATRLHPIPSPE